MITMFRFGNVIFTILILLKLLLATCDGLELSQDYKYLNLFQLFEIQEEGVELLDLICPESVKLNKTEDEDSLQVNIAKESSETKCFLKDGTNQTIKFEQLRNGNETDMNQNQSLSVEQVNGRFPSLTNVNSNIQIECPLISVSSKLNILAQDVGYIYTIIEYYRISGKKLGVEPNGIPIEALSMIQDEYMLRLSLEEMGEVSCAYVSEAVSKEIMKRIEQVKQGTKEENESEEETKEADDTDDTDDDGSACFPASSLVKLRNGELISMEKLRIGDEIGDEKGSYSQVMMFTHSDKYIVHKFVRISSEKGDLVVSPSHYIYANGKLVVAGSVQVGDGLLSIDGESRVKKVEYVEERGLYNPQTRSGKITIYSNESYGFVASCYTCAIDPVMAHTILMPIRWLQNELHINFTWLSHLFRHGWPLTSKFYR